MNAQEAQLMQYDRSRIRAISFKLGQVAVLEKSRTRRFAPNRPQSTPRSLGGAASRAGAHSHVYWG